MKPLNLNTGDRIRLKSLPKHWTSSLWEEAVGKEWEVVNIVHEDCVILKWGSILNQLYIVNSKDLEYFELVNGYGEWPCWL